MSRLGRKVTCRTPNTPKARKANTPSPYSIWVYYLSPKGIDSGLDSELRNAVGFYEDGGGIGIEIDEERDLSWDFESPAKAKAAARRASRLPEVLWIDLYPPGSGRPSLIYQRKKKHPRGIVRGPRWISDPRGLGVTLSDRKTGDVIGHYHSIDEAERAGVVSLPLQAADANDAAGSIRQYISRWYWR